MARSPRFRKDRGAWFVTIDGIRHNLGPDRKPAFTRFHDLMAKPEKRAVASESLLALIDRFLEYVQHHRAPDTYEWYRSRLQLFAKRHPDLATADLKPIHVQEWIDSYADVASGTKRNLGSSIQRCLRWAEEMGLVDRSPIAAFKKPRGGKPERVLSDAEWKAILACVPDPEFRDLLVVTWETGCRPQESLRVEARHVDLVNSRWIFPESESKTNAPRTAGWHALRLCEGRGGRHFFVFDVDAILRGRPLVFRFNCGRNTQLHALPASGRATRSGFFVRLPSSSYS